MARFEVVYVQSGAPRPTVDVVSRTRRENGAINEADRYLQDAYANMILHRDDNHVIMGPVRSDRYDWAVIEYTPDWKFVRYRRIYIRRRVTS